MPKKIDDDHNTFRGILTEANKKYLKSALKSGTIFAKSRQMGITIPRMSMPNFTFNGTEYSMDQETPKKKKPKLYRSIEDPFEPAW